MKFITAIIIFLLGFFILVDSQATAALVPATSDTPIKEATPVKQEPAPSNEKKTEEKKAETIITPQETKPAEPVFTAVTPLEQTESIVGGPESAYLYLNTPTTAIIPQTRYESLPFSLEAHNDYTFATAIVPYNLAGATHNGGVRISLVCWEQSGCVSTDGSQVPFDTQIAVIPYRPGSVPQNQLGGYIKKKLSPLRFPVANPKLIVRVTAGYGTEVAIDEIKISKNSNPTHNIIANGSFSQSIPDQSITRNYPAYFREQTNNSFEHFATEGKARLRGKYETNVTAEDDYMNTFFVRSSHLTPVNMFNQMISYKGRVLKKRSNQVEQAKIVITHISTSTVVRVVPLDMSGEEQQILLANPLPYPGRYLVQIQVPHGVELEVDRFGMAGGNVMTPNLNLDESISIQSATRQPSNWTAGTNNFNYAYGEIIQNGVAAPGDQPDTTP